MYKTNKLRAVVRHEFLTIIKQPSFWISLIAFPAVAGIVLLIGALTDTPQPTLDSARNTRTISVIDNSNLIQDEAIKSQGMQKASPAQEQSLRKAVRQGTLDGLIIYPKNLEQKGTYYLLADNTKEDNGTLVSELGRITLQQSLLAPLKSEKLASLALTGGSGEVQSFKKGEPARKTGEYIVPGAFLILFYIVLIFSVGYALSSVSEEKENRSVEMVLSYVKSRTLIVGKLLAIIFVTLTQIVVIGLLAAIAYAIAKSLGNDLALPFSISELTFIPSEILIGLGFLVFGFVFYVGLMAMIGAIFPSSKEASGFSTVFFILPAIPFWGIDAITNQPSASFTQILTYFPLTSPTTVLTRNAVGNLGLLEGLIALGVLIVSTLAIIALATKAFRLGTLELSDRVKLGSLLRK